MLTLSTETNNGKSDGGESSICVQALQFFRGGDGDITRMGYIGHAHAWHVVAPKVENKVKNALTLLISTHWDALHQNSLDYNIGSSSTQSTKQGTCEALCKMMGATSACDLVLFSDSCFAELKQWKKKNKLKLYRFTLLNKTFYVVPVPAAQRVCELTEGGST